MSDIESDTKHEVSNLPEQKPEETESNLIEKQQSENEEDVDIDDLFGEDEQEEGEQEEKEGSEKEESEQEESDTDYQQEIKIAEAELPKHIVPYKGDYDSEMTMQSRLPPF